jgi:hypothetical protein
MPNQRDNKMQMWLERMFNKPLGQQSYQEKRLNTHSVFLSHEIPRKTTHRSRVFHSTGS